MMRRIFLLAFMLAWPRLAGAAGGVQIDEQSARGIGTASAQTAVAADPGCVFYNPAGMVYLPGFNVQAGGNIIYAATRVESTETTKATHTYLLPQLYITQRIGRHIAVGVGFFANMGEHFGYPTNWPGRFIGQFVDLTTATFNLNLAVRLLPNVSLAAGLDVMVAQIDLYRALNFGESEGSVHIAADAVGVGGNVGLLVDLVPKRLRFGVSYRSRIDLDFGGHGSISAPPELRSLTGGRLDASATLPLPHNFAVGLAVEATSKLTLTGDVRVTLWRDVQSIPITLTNPQAPPGTPSTTETIVLDLHNTWGLRFGGELRLLDGALPLRLGVGYLTSPVPDNTLGPLLPDSQRVLVSAGAGWHLPSVAFDVAYMWAGIIERTSANPDFHATYVTNAHLFALSTTVRIGAVARHIKEEQPAEERNEAAPPPRRPLP